MLPLGSVVGTDVADVAHRTQDGPDHLADQRWTPAMLEEHHHRYNRQHDTEMHTPPAQQALSKCFHCQLEEVQTRADPPKVAWSSRRLNYSKVWKM